MDPFGWAQSSVYRALSSVSGCQIEESNARACSVLGVSRAKESAARSNALRDHADFGVVVTGGSAWCAARPKTAPEAETSRFRRQRAIMTALPPVWHVIRSDSSGSVQARAEGGAELSEWIAQTRGPAERADATQASDPGTEQRPLAMVAHLRVPPSCVCSGAALDVWDLESHGPMLLASVKTAEAACRSDEQLSSMVVAPWPGAVAHAGEDAGSRGSLAMLTPCGAVVGSVELRTVHLATSEYADGIFASDETCKDLIEAAAHSFAKSALPARACVAGVSCLEDYHWLAEPEQSGGQIDPQGRAARLAEPLALSRCMIPSAALRSSDADVAATGDWSTVSADGPSGRSNFGAAIRQAGPAEARQAALARAGLLSVEDISVSNVEPRQRQSLKDLAEAVASSLSGANLDVSGRVFALGRSARVVGQSVVVELEKERRRMAAVDEWTVRAFPGAAHSGRAGGLRAAMALRALWGGGDDDAGVPLAELLAELHGSCGPEGLGDLVRRRAVAELPRVRAAVLLVDRGLDAHGAAGEGSTGGDLGIDGEGSTGGDLLLGSVQGAVGVGAAPGVAPMWVGRFTPAILQDRLQALWRHAQAEAVLFGGAGSSSGTLGQQLRRFLVRRWPAGPQTVPPPPSPLMPRSPARGDARPSKPRSSPAGGLHDPCGALWARLWLCLAPEAFAHAADTMERAVAVVAAAGDTAIDEEAEALALALQSVTSSDGIGGRTNPWLRGECGDSIARLCTAMGKVTAAIGKESRPVGLPAVDMELCGVLDAVTTVLFGLSLSLAPVVDGTGILPTTAPLALSRPEQGTAASALAELRNAAAARASASAVAASSALEARTVEVASAALASAPLDSALAEPLAILDQTLRRCATAPGRGGHGGAASASSAAAAADDCGAGPLAPQAEGVVGGASSQELLRGACVVAAAVDACLAAYAAHGPAAWMVRAAAGAAGDGKEAEWPSVGLHRVQLPQEETVRERLQRLLLVLPWHTVLAELEPGIAAKRHETDTCPTSHVAALVEAQNYSVTRLRQLLPWLGQKDMHCLAVATVPGAGPRECTAASLCVASATRHLMAKLQEVGAARCLGWALPGTLAEPGRPEAETGHGLTRKRATGDTSTPAAAAPAGTGGGLFAGVFSAVKGAALAARSAAASGVSALAASANEEDAGNLGRLRCCDWDDGGHPLLATAALIISAGRLPPGAVACDTTGAGIAALATRSASLLATVFRGGGGDGRSAAATTSAAAATSPDRRRGEKKRDTLASPGATAAGGVETGAAGRAARAALAHANLIILVPVGGSTGADLVALRRVLASAAERGTSYRPVSVLTHAMLTHNECRRVNLATD